MLRVRKAVDYQGYSSGSRRKHTAAMRRARAAADAVVAMFAAAAKVSW